MNEKGTALFKKRYQHVLRFQTFWIGFYVVAGELGNIPAT